MSIRSEDKDGRRLVSPSPSLRHISHRRVNYDRTRLVSARGIEYQSVYEGDNQPMNLGRSTPMAENDSVLYYGTGLPGTQNSRSSPDPAATGSGQQASQLAGQMEYHPTGSEFEWRDLLPYYFPIFSWIDHYSIPFFVGDLVGGLSLVFFQLPLSLSYATSLAHVPVICGLLSLAISPFVYLIFGSVPQMIVGPESAILLVVGQAVEPILHHNKHHINPIDLVVALSFVSGATLLGFGLGRFGFLDNVLSASLLKGFISGVGIVMIIGSAIQMLGLGDLMQQISDDPSDMDIHSTFDKFRFLCGHYKKYDSLTFEISIIAFLFLVVVGKLKSLGSKKQFRGLAKLVYVPEILIMVIVSSYCCYKFSWKEKGIAVIGRVKDETGGISLHNPLTLHQFKLMKKVSTSGFLCAMLGFFESTTALKSLGSRYNLPISSNRELVALGFINLMTSVFGALPAFGGYGRSKINAMSAKTTMLGAIMGVCTLFTVVFLLDGLYYIPKCILSVITAKIGFLLIEEAPYELMFHWKSRGYNELITFFVTVLTTLFFSMEAGIAVGLVYLLMRVIKHSALSRIQILGRIPGTNTFVDADINPSLLTVHDQDRADAGYNQDRAGHLGKEHQLNLFTDDHFTTVNLGVLEEIEGCLIVKIPEPLTFTNTSDLRGRLKRVEMYGSTKAHPGSKRSRDESMTQYIIFDLRGMSELDSSASQMLRELILGYQARGILLFFVRVSKHYEVRNRLERTGITELLRGDLGLAGYYEVNGLARLTNSETDSGIYDLTESLEAPFFGHISDALKVIDYYETSANGSFNNVSC